MIDKYLDKLEFNNIKSKLIEFTHTFIGKELAENLEPSSNKDTVQKTLDETGEALRLIHEKGVFPIGEASDLRLNIKKLESGISLNAKSLLEIAEILKTSRELCNYYNDSGLMLDNLSIYFDDLYSNIDIEKRIFSSIISEDTISDTASSKLASIRRNKKSLEFDIKNKLNGFIHSNTYSKYLMDAVITIRAGRYVIPVREEYKGQIKGFIHDVSSSGSTVYIEPMSIFEMNNSITNLNVDEAKEIERILEELSSNLYPISGYIAQDNYIIGKLDFISAKAKYAIENDCNKPYISDYIELKNARHPLIDKDKVVPITIALGKDYRCLVITGPNTGGKTVTLKTAGLLCIMAQAGLYIPALEGSTIKVFDNIFADIGDEQSIEASLSTFSSHIKNIVHILETFTENSLILVDELGSGTDPIEGANLALSLLEYFYNKEALVLATTHYHEIKNYCISHDGFENASVEFDIETLSPTYNLLLGIPGKSNAFAISKRLGIPTDIIDRASSLISKPETDIETLMKDIYDDKVEIEKNKIETEKNLNQIETLRRSLEHEYSEKLDKEKEKIEKAKREAKEILLDAKERANSIIRELNDMSEADTKKTNKLRDELNSSIKSLGGEPTLDLSVLLKLNNQYGEKDDKDDSAKSVKSTDSNNAGKRNANKNDRSNSKSGSVSLNNNKAQSISAEINLIGENVASAVEILDKYLDNCIMAHLSQVRVVHGKGTGKLRQGIHEYLKKCKYVQSFNIAGFGEGDYGVTIVNLKK